MKLLHGGQIFFSTAFFGLNVGKEFYEVSHIAQELEGTLMAVEGIDRTTPCQQRSSVPWIE